MNIKTGLHRTGRFLATIATVCTFIINLCIGYTLCLSIFDIIFVAFFISLVACFFYLLIFSALMRFVRWVVDGFTEEKDRISWSDCLIRKRDIL